MIQFESPSRLNQKKPKKLVKKEGNLNGHDWSCQDLIAGTWKESIFRATSSVQMKVSEDGLKSLEEVTWEGFDVTKKDRLKDSLELCGQPNPVDRIRLFFLCVCLNSLQRNSNVSIKNFLMITASSRSITHQQTMPVENVCRLIEKDRSCFRLKPLTGSRESPLCAAH